MLEEYWTDLKRWAKQPYKENGTVLDWTLFIGFMLAITYLWTRVIARILD